MKKLILCVSAALVFLCCFVPAADDDAYTKGVAAYIAGNSDEAMLQLYKAHRADPGDNRIKALLAEVYIDQASKFIAVGDYVTASKYAGEAEKLNVMDDKVIKLKESLKTLSETAPEKPPAKKAAPKKTPPPAVEKTVQKSGATVRAQPEKAAPETIIIRERLIEKQGGGGMSTRAQSAIAAVILLLVAGIAMAVLKLYLNAQSRESARVEDMISSEKRLQKELNTLKESAARVKTELDEEKKKSAREASQARKNKGQKDKDEQIDSCLKKMEDSLHSVRTECDRARESDKAVFPAKTAVPLTDFLPEYTEIPIEASALSEMLERASGRTARLNLLWALGNKTELKAVETLNKQLDRAKGEEYREILKSLKKIALRLDTAQPVKTAVEDIFAGQRRKGIII